MIEKNGGSRRRKPFCLAASTQKGRGRLQPASFGLENGCARKIIESYDEGGNIEHVILSKKIRADICACFQKQPPSV